MIPVLMPFTATPLPGLGSHRVPCGAASVQAGTDAIAAPIMRGMTLAGIVRAAIGSMDDEGQAGRIDVALAEPALRLPVQPEPLAHALLNLLVNACRYSGPDSRVRLRGERQWADDAEHIVLTVCDRGLGMSRAHQQRAFDAYWQGPTVAAGPGRGLGLTVARELIEDQGGWLELRSALGIGTEVSIWLPLTLSAGRSA